ncbi:MAG: cytochrome c peroxidase [Planctomycetota bacterium]
MKRLLLSSCFIAICTLSSPSSFAAETVQLGDPTLTSGIPGEGPLTLEQARKWLEDDSRHASLNIELPSGLAVGKDAIYIPEDNPITRAKIELGRQLYFDRRLSKDSTVSCADCHHPDNGYAKDTQFGVGVKGQTGNRNSPTSYNRILSKAQFWDGRAGSLEDQAVGPIANPIEMGNTHEAIVEFLKSNEVYRLQFERVFGQAPNIDDVGRAIATFERTIVTGDSPYDAYEPFVKLEQYLASEFDEISEAEEEEPEMYAKYTALKAKLDTKPMSESAIRGKEIFFGKEANCTACHVGANFADEKYHNLGVGMTADKPDMGRHDVTGEEADKGAFKTPTLRNVALTAPYMHDGSQKTLREVVEWYAKGGHPNPTLSDKIKKFDASEQDIADLVAFMESLTGEFPKVEMDRLPK